MKIHARTLDARSALGNAMRAEYVFPAPPLGAAR
jgi:hypothetical protein